MKEIKSVEEMNALPAGSVVIDESGDAWQKRGYNGVAAWVMAGIRSEPESAETVFEYSPLLLVFEPGEDPNDGADPLTQKMIDGINSNPIARRAFGRLADAYADGAL